MRVWLTIHWADGTPPSVDEFVVSPFMRWERNLASYRTERGRLLNAAVVAVFDQPSTMFVALWNHPSYDKADTYGYFAMQQCVTRIVQ